LLDSKSFSKIANVFNINHLKKLNKNDLATILYWGSKKKEEICLQLQKWFIENKDELETIVIDIDNQEEDKKLSKWIQDLENEFI
jgi:hypothetical protein